MTTAAAEVPAKVQRAVGSPGVNARSVKPAATCVRKTLEMSGGVSNEQGDEGWACAIPLSNITAKKAVAAIAATIPKRTKPTIKTRGRDPSTTGSNFGAGIHPAAATGTSRT